MRSSCKSTTPENEKATAPVPAVGAAGEQSIINKTTDIITEKPGERNLLKGSLDTISMTDLFDTAYPPKSVMIENLLYAGTYLFVGAPKIGKSFFMAQLSYHIATGTPLWQYDVHPGEVLYLALEDDYARIQKRLFKMFGMEGTDALHFATQSRTLVIDALHQHRIIGMDDTLVHYFIDRADGVLGFTIIFQLVMLHIFEQPE